jgi:hypothetical protein
MTIDCSETVLVTSTAIDRTPARVATGLLPELSTVYTLTSKASAGAVPEP